MSVEENIDEIDITSDDEYFATPPGQISLSDLIPEYPSPDDPELAAKLYALKEFRELQEPFGKGPGDRLFNHQEAVARWTSPLTGVSSVIVITDPGMGKTSVGVAFCEQGIYEKGKRVLFVASSKTILTNIKREIIKTVAGKYKVPQDIAGSSELRKENSSSNKPIVLTKKVTIGNAINNTNQNTNTLKSNGIAGGDKPVVLNTDIPEGNLNISDYYEFRTHKVFAGIIRANFDPETDSLKKSFLDKYKGVTIVIDEPHHIRATAEGSKAERIITDTALGKVFGGMDRVQWLSGIRADYRAFALFLHSVENIRKCGLTATPATDKLAEYFFTMNLFLPTNRIFIASSRSFIQYLNMDAEELKKVIYEHCKGHVAYAHAKYKAKRIEVGEQIGVNTTEDGEEVRFTTTYIPCVMSDTQYEVIRRIEQEEGVTGIGEIPEDILQIDDADKRENAFMNKARNASNFIFPYNRQYFPGNESRIKANRPVSGGAGGEVKSTKAKKIAPTNTKKTNKTATPTKQKKTVVVENKKSAQKKAKEPSIFDYYIRGDPAEGWDFVEAPNDPKRQEDIDRLKSIVRSLDPDGGLPSIAPKYAKIIEYLKRDDKRVTYIYCPFVIGSGVAALYVTILQYEGFEAYRGQDIIRLNNENERYRAAGKPIPKRIAVITSKIVGNKGQEQLDIFNNPANKYGALIYAIIGSPASGEAISFFNIRRVITLSFPWNASTKKQVDGRAFRIGRGHEAFNEEESNVEIINLAAIAPPGAYEDNVTPDLRVMMIAELKGKEIATVIRDTKECAFDGLINHKLNQRPDLKGYTLDTDYAPSTYKVISGDVTIDGDAIKPKKLRTGNYDLYYDIERRRPIEEITKYLREKTSATFDELMENLNFERTALIFALDTLLQTRTRIQDAFGSYAYIVEKDNLIFLQPEYRDPDPLFIHYQRCKYISIPGESSIYREEARQNVNDFYAAVLADPDSADTLFSDLYNNIQTRVGLLYEGWYDGTYNFDNVPAAEKVILNRFKTSTGFIEVDKLKDKKGVSTSGVSKEYGNILFYHKLYYVGQNIKSGDSSKYAKGARLKPAIEMRKPNNLTSKLRVYDGDKQAWRYATDEEDKIIVELENNKDAAIKDSMSGNEVWGIKYVLDGTSSLVFPKEENRKETKTTGKEGSKKDDQRYRVRGRATKDGNKSIMFWVMWHLSQLTDPHRYYLDYVYKEKEAKESRETWLGDIRPDPNTVKQSSRKYRESATGIPLSVLADNLPMLSFFRWAFTSNLVGKSANPDKIEQTSSYQIEKRLEELGLLVER